MTKVLMALFGALSCIAGNDVFQSLTLEEALERAKIEKKLIFIDFFTDWCGPCQKMKRTTFKDPQVLGWLAQNTIPLSVNANDNTALAARFSVDAYPTLLFLKADASIVLREEGGCDPSAFLRLCSLALEGKSLLQVAREDAEAHPEDGAKRAALAERLLEVGERDQSTALLVQVFAEKQSGQHPKLSQGYLYQSLNRCGTAAADALLSAEYARYRQLLIQGDASGAAIKDMVDLMYFTRRPFLKLYEALKQAGSNLQPMHQCEPFLLREFNAAGRYEEAEAFQPAAQRLQDVNTQIESLKRLPADAQGEMGFLNSHKQEVFLLLLGLKRTDQAIAVANELLDATGHNCEMYNSLAWEAYERNYVDETVLAWAKKACTLSNRKAEYIDTYARVLALSGQTAAALKLVEEAMATATEEGRPILVELQIDLQRKTP